MKRTDRDTLPLEVKKSKQDSLNLELECPVVLSEGSAKITFDREDEVFYNKVQVFNRDLSVMVISMFYEQLQIESLHQNQLKLNCKPWRQLKPTLQSWGADNYGDIHQVQVSTKDEEPRCLRLLEALSATGLRSIRYIKEIPGTKHIVINDIDPAAVQAIKRNLEYNQIEKHSYHVNQGDAAQLMFNSRSIEKQFDVIDLDPYGSASVFIDTAVQSVANGGLLAITCTDLSVLCGSHMDACYSKYGAVPLKAPYCHEMALRIVLADLNRQAAKYKRYIVPLYCVRVDFYVRLFVRVYESAKECRLSSAKISNVYQCCRCDNFVLQPLGRINPKNGHSMPARGPIVGPRCEHCGGEYVIGGPIWNKPMLNREFGNQLLVRLSSFAKKRKIDKSGDSSKSDSKQTISVPSYTKYVTTGSRIIAEISKALREVHDAPLFWSLSSICKTLRCTAPSIAKVQTALKNAGYEVSQSATNPDSIKTDANASTMWDIFREWIEMNPRNEKHANDKNEVSNIILKKKPKLSVDFESGFKELKAKRKRERSETTRYQLNPEKYWGPKSRATGFARKKKVVIMNSKK